MLSSMALSTVKLESSLDSQGRYTLVLHCTRGTREEAPREEGQAEEMERRYLFFARAASRSRSFWIAASRFVSALATAS